MQGSGRKKNTGNELRDRRLRHGAGVDHAAPTRVAIFARPRGAGVFFRQRSSQQLGGAGERQVPPVLRLRSWPAEARRAVRALTMVLSLVHGAIRIAPL